MTSVTRPATARSPLFDRLGGFEVVDRAVTRGLTRAALEPGLVGVLPEVPGADAAWQAQLYLTELAGGPMAYDGPDPTALAAERHLEPGQVARLIALLAEAFEAEGAPADAVAELREALLADATRRGFGAAPPPALAVAPPPSATEALTALAAAEAGRQGMGDWNLFVLDPGLTLVAMNAGARAAVLAAEPDLRRSFNLGAADLVGHAILRIHPAPTQFSAQLTDSGRSPRESTWCFGRAVWKARPFPVSRDGRIAGYGVAWQDVTDQHRTEAVFQRLRSQAEDLPVPVMLPDATQDRWFGNAACEAALARLARYLPRPVNPSDGVPVGLFFPDAEERRRLFADAARLPHKAQVRFGPETVAVLVSPVLDQDQRYLGPQITWEIVHRSEPAAPSPVAAPEAPLAAPAAPAAGGPAAAPALAGGLREESRALAAVSAELVTLTRLLESVADEAERVEEPLAEDAAQADARPEALQLADAAVREALRAVRAAGREAALAVAGEARGLAQELSPRLAQAAARAQASADAIRQIRAMAAGLSDLRATGGSPREAGGGAPDALP